MGLFSKVWDYLEHRSDNRKEKALARIAARRDNTSTRADARIAAYENGIDPRSSGFSALSSSVGSLGNMFSSITGFKTGGLEAKGLFGQSTTGGTSVNPIVWFFAAIVGIFLIFKKG